MASQAAAMERELRQKRSAAASGARGARAATASAASAVVVVLQDAEMTLPLALTVAQQHCNSPAGRLGLPPEASATALKRRFRLLARFLHPDKHVGAESAFLAKVESAFKEVSKAYVSLTNAGGD